MKEIKSERMPVALLGVFLVTLTSGIAEQGEIRDVATHEQLTQTLQEALQADPMKSLPESVGEDPAPASRPPDLLSQSDIISFGGLATLLPKRAILQIPQHLASRMVLEPDAKLVSWAEFYAVNYGWITTVEVSRTQAEGNEAMAKESETLLSKSKNLVVATYQRGPISVLPLKPEVQSKLSKL